MLNKLSRIEQNGENLHVFFKSNDPQYDLRVTLRGVKDPSFSLSAEVEKELNELIRSVQTAVQGHFSKTDPLGWGVCYDPEVGETHVICTPNAASVLDQYNGNYVQMERNYRPSCCAGEKIHLSKCKPGIENVADAMGRAYAKMAVENRFPEIPGPYRLPAPSFSLIRAFPRRTSSLDRASKRLFKMINDASIALQGGRFQNTFLGPLQWSDLLHEDRMYGDRRSVNTQCAEDAIENLIKDPQSKEADARLFKQWLLAIAEQAKKEAPPKFVYYLISSLKGFYGGENYKSQKAIIDEINSSLGL